MSCALSNILERLKDVRKRGDSYTALCPAHEDSNPSLSISIGEDGRVLLKCHAGCSTEAICAALSLKLSDLFEPDQTKKRARVSITYDYREVDGTLMHQTVRYEPKGFKQRRPDGVGGWKWSLKGVKRILYNLPELSAAPDDERFIISEGEKDCDNLARLGLIATTCPQGAGKWKHLSDDAVLDGHPITIITDKDAAGRKHAHDVAMRLTGRAAEVRMLELPGDGKDASDWLEQGGTKEELVALAESAPHSQPQEQRGEADEQDEDKAGKRKSQATLLVELCEDVELFHDDDVAYASVLIDGSVETLPGRGRAFKRWLGRQFYKEAGKAAGGQAIADAINVIEGKALFDGPEVRVHIRIAEQDGVIYIDLADRGRHVVRVNAEGWEVIHNSPVRFRRPRAFRALPIPVRGGSLTALRRYINVDSDDDFILLAAWLVAAFRPDRPFPLLAFNSEQGSGKSTAVRMLRSLIDPNEAPIRCEPRDVRDLMIAANNGWVVALDNLSHVAIWLSDSMCRMSTGGGLSTRVLYENDEEQIFNVLRPVIINGIEELGTRSDLLDRTIRVALPSIPEDRRRPEDVLYAEFDRDRPAILGAILDAVSAALKGVSQVRLDRYPRMADFAKWTVAAESSLPWNEGEFMRAYFGNRDGAHELALEACLVGDVVRQFAAREVEWTGSATELLHALEEMTDEGMRRKKGWPKQPHILSGTLRRLAPNLRAVGVDIDFSSRTKRSRAITIRSMAQNSVTSVTERHPTHCGSPTGDSGDAVDRQGDAPQTLARAVESRFTMQNRIGDADDAGDARLQALSGDIHDAIDEAEERAAIMEYDGGLTREEAEERSGLHLLNGQLGSIEEAQSGRRMP